MSLRDDVTQPVSLADELRTLAEKWRRTYEEGQPIGSKGAFTYDIEKRCADELSALLAQHAVAEPSKGLLSEPVQAFIRSNKGVSLDLSSYQDGDDELPVEAHAVEQPKLTDIELYALVRRIRTISFDGQAVDLLRAALLTSPVAPPPQQKENDDATKMR